jgi:ribosomal protein S18 acetylase RimI-like enzyme
MPPLPTIRSHLPPHFTAAALPVRLHFASHDATLRLLQPGDARLLVEFFESHSAETIYQRYGYAGARMTQAQALRLVSVDQSLDAALGVFESFARRVQLIAIGRYCLAADGRWAEVAFVVHEERRGLGIGTTLLAALKEIAQQRRLERLVAEVRQGNGPMLAILRGAGATFVAAGEPADLEATLTLSAGTGPRELELTRAAPRRHCSEGVAALNTQSTWLADRLCRQSFPP